MAYENQVKKRARAINAAIGKASTGTHQIAVEFEYLEEQGGITYYGPLTDAAFEYTMKAIRTAGFEGDDLSELGSLCQDTPEVVLVIGPEEYNGKTTLKVKFINSVGGLALKDALQGDDLKTFARKMKGKIVAYDRSAGPSAPRQPAAARQPAQPTGDDGEFDPDRLEQRAHEETGGGRKRLDDIPF